MALNKNDLLSLVATNIPDNTNGDITPASVRQVLEQMVSSDANLEDLTEQFLLGLLKVKSLQFDTAIALPPYAEGQTFYDNTEKSLSYYNDESDTVINVGQEIVFRVHNDTASIITNGQVVRDGASSIGGYPTAVPSLATSVIGSEAIGLATHDIPVGETGFITYIGRVGGLDTSSFTVGDRLYVSSTIAGGLTKVPPSIVNVVGICVVSDASEGIIIVAPSEVADPFALGQNLSTTGSSQSLTTTPIPLEGYLAVSGLEQGVIIDTSVGAGGGNRCSISPAAAAFSGFYDISFNLTGTSSANVTIAAEVYVNAAPTGLIQYLDLTNNNINAGSISIPRTFTSSVITEADSIEIYIYTTSGVTVFTNVLVAFNAKRAGIA